MLLKWNPTRLKIVTDLIGEANVLLAPGFNEVDNEVWGRIRVHVQDSIKRGDLEEKFAKLELLPKKKQTDLDVYKVVESLTLKDLSLTEASEVVEHCFNMKVLEQWKSVESRDSVRATILNQISSINNPKKSKEKGKK